MKVTSQCLFLLVLVFQPLRYVSASQTPDPIEFRNYEVENGFPQSLTFKIEVCNAPENHLVYLHYQIGQSPWENTTSKAFSYGKSEDGCRRLRTTVFNRDEPPMLDVRYYWVLRMKGGQARSPLQEYIYEDPQFDWQTLQNEDLILYWHDRPEEFGKKIFDIAVRSLALQRDLYATQLRFPAQIVISNTKDEFISWQSNPEPDTGGLALPWHGLTIQLVPDNSENWLNEVLPHEISHLYFYQATLHSDVWPPRWLNEGLAVYYEFGDHQYEEELVREAVLRENLIPLLSLRADFNEEEYDVGLAYAESYSTAVYILERHGKEKLARLLQEYDFGKDHDEVFVAAFDQSLDEFEKDWEIWVKSRFEITVPPTATPLPPTNQQQSPASYPGRNVLALLALLGCFSVTGVTGLGIIIIIGLSLWKAGGKKTAP